MNNTKNKNYYLNIFIKLKDIKNLPLINIKINNEIINLNIGIINIFDIKIKHTKDKNDYNNKIREYLICCIINNQIPESWYKYHYKWNLIKIQLDIFLKKLINNLTYKSIECVCKGGRNFNYDFDIIFTLEDNSELIKKIEFKFGCDKIDKYPQFLSLSTKDNCLYADYFYDNFVDNISRLYNLDYIEKKNYIKNIYGINYNNNNWFKFLYEKDKYIEKISKENVNLNNEVKEFVSKNEEFNKLVELSINNFIMIYSYNLNFEDLTNKFLKTQKDKEYMCYKGDFYYDYIDKKELSIKKISGFKGSKKYKNTIVLETYCDTKIYMFLRWKNHYGILNPAWQISIKRK